MADLNKTIGARVREARTKRGMTQLQLVAATDFEITPGFLSLLERGLKEWRVPLVEVFARVLDVDVLDLMRDVQHGGTVTEAAPAA